MKPVRLYIENFMAHERSFIDFNEFNSAAIIGRLEGNDFVSNGAGKTAIFKAIEYVLFNQADVNLEKIIRDDTSFCKVVLDFIVDNQEYRLSRTRTKKGNTDLSLLQRNTVEGSDYEVYHSKVSNEIFEPIFDRLTVEKYWRDLSASRAGDTEKYLSSLIKINYKSCRSTIHFVQNDFSGLPTATPEKRKLILKDALNLLIYSKLEKIAKERSSILAKDIDKNRVLIETLGTPQEEINKLSEQLLIIDNDLLDKNNSLDIANASYDLHNKKVSELNNFHSSLVGKLSSLLSQNKTLLSDKDRLEISIKEYQNKKDLTIKIAKELIDNIKIYKEKQSQLNLENYQQLESLSEQISNKKEQISDLSLQIKNNNQKIDKLNNPLPEEEVCSTCYQLISDQYKEECHKKLQQEINSLHDRNHTKQDNKNRLIIELSQDQQLFKDLIDKKKQLEEFNNKITIKDSEIKEKKKLYTEYGTLIDNLTRELNIKNNEINNVKLELDHASANEINKIKLKIKDEELKLKLLEKDISSQIKEINQINNNKAIIQHIIQQKRQDILQKEFLNKILSDLEIKFSVFPSVLQAFSSAGIPNLIIQNVLDDLQIESNNLLNQIKPGLQLTFKTEKVQGNGVETDTLDILYTINGKERYFEQLSGAQKLTITFSLKLGLSFILQKMMGINIKFLMLDEIDQSLDRASVDALVEIIKFFQKDYCVLIITHNDYLKDKFNKVIMVEQNNKMISTAKVISI